MQLLSWSPILGCSYASPGCLNCRSLAIAEPDLQHEFRRHGLVQETKAGVVWTGEVLLSVARLQIPAQQQKPAVFSVCPFGDLFHPNIPDSWIDRVFEIMESCSIHAFQLLSKRAARQRDYILARYKGARAPANIFAGVSVERQIEANERIPLLLDTRANIYLTVYPLLEAIDLRPFIEAGTICQVFVGSEKERPAAPEWIEQIERDCADAGVPCVVSNRLVGEQEAAE